jgi:hypothetical protein
MPHCDLFGDELPISCHQYSSPERGESRFIPLHALLLCENYLAVRGAASHIAPRFLLVPQETPRLPLSDRPKLALEFLPHDFCRARHADLSIPIHFSIPRGLLVGARLAPWPSRDRIPDTSKLDTFDLDGATPKLFVEQLLHSVADARAQLDGR